MMDTDRGVPTIAEAARQIKAGMLSPVTLVKNCLSRIDKYEPTIQAFHVISVSYTHLTLPTICSV